MTTLDPSFGLTSYISLALHHGVPDIDVMNHGRGNYSARCGDVVIHGTAELLQQFAADLAAALADAVGFTPPRAAVGSELVDYVGHQFRVLDYSLSDGKDVWSEWRTIDAVDGSPFGNSVAVKWHVRTADVDCVTVVPGSSEVAEGDAVQVRVRLHADDDAKAAVA